MKKTQRNETSSRRKFWKLGIKDFNTQYFDFNKDGDLIVKEGNNQYNVRYLADKLGTPLEIFFPFILEERVEDLLDLVGDLAKKLQYKGKFFYHYPMKVNQNKEVVMSLVGEGANLETGSYNELWLVKRMVEQESFNPKIRIICNGPKTDKYINFIDDLQHRGLKVIPIIEGQNELKVLQYSRFDIGIRLDIPLKVQSRWDKAVDRFGFSADELLSLGKIRNLKVLHYHVGSQIELLSNILDPIKYALDVYFKLKKINPSIDSLDIGGGMPIPYDRIKRYSVNNLLEKILTLIKTEADKNCVPHPDLRCEWGRYIVAPSQITVYKVIDVKKIPPKNGCAKKWYVIDGSFMNDLLDTWAIHQKWHVVPGNSLADKKPVKVWLAGSSCDSDDIYTGQGSSVLLPNYDGNSGQSLYLAFLDSGAYQDPLASHHCLLSSPLKAIAENGHIMVIRRRETPEDVGKLFGW